MSLLHSTAGGLGAAWGQLVVVVLWSITLCYYNLCMLHSSLNKRDVNAFVCFVVFLCLFVCFFVYFVACITDTLNLLYTDTLAG